MKGASEGVGPLFRPRMKRCAKYALVGREGRVVRLRRAFWRRLVGRAGSAVVAAVAVLGVVQADLLLEFGPIDLQSTLWRLSQPTEGNEVIDDPDASRQRLSTRQRFSSWVKEGVSNALVFLAPEGRHGRRPIVLQPGVGDIA
jgi:hypothetical protein